MFDKSNQIRAIYQTQLGNLAQFLVSILLGIIGLVTALQLFETNIRYEWSIGLAVLALISGLLIYFKPAIITKRQWFNKIYLKDQANIDHLVAVSKSVKTPTVDFESMQVLYFYTAI